MTGSMRSRDSMLLFKGRESLIILFLNMSTSIPSDGYKFYRLSENLESATATAKDILKYGIRKEHLQAKLSVKTGGVQYETTPIFLREEKPEKVDRLKNEILTKFPDVKFTEILLLVGKLTRKSVKCPNCNEEMRSDNLSRHLKSCANDQYCPVCQKEVEGDLKEHIDKCCRKTYNCNVCDESFNTGARRTAHQKKCQKKTFDCRVCGEPFNTRVLRTEHEKICRVADEKTIPRALRDGAIDGLFRIVTIVPKIKTFDYEGFMEDEVDHIVETISNQMDSGLKFYISIELYMRHLIDDTAKIATFQTRSTVLLRGMDIEPVVREHMNLIDIKIDKYIQNGSGWTVDNVKAMNVMMTRYNPIGFS